MTPPPCPITGEPATRLVQWVSARMLSEMWRRGLRVDVGGSFKDTRRFGLWESPTGLYFFDPMLEGDAGFYTSLYERLNLRHHWNEKNPRAEFRLAAGHVREGERVLDVGCGYGSFRFAVRHARYTGLDPHFSGEPSADWARIETLSDHLRDNAGAYDVCAAFQVLEHVEDPVRMVSDMMRAVRPGGRVIVGVPHVPSVHTRIPNYLITAIPHHLTWWTKDALLAIAARTGLTKARVETAPWDAADGIVWWIERCSLVKCRGDVHFRHSWAWHASSVVSFLAGYAMWRIKPVPTGTRDEGASLLLVAEKPA